MTLRSHCSFDFTTDEMAAIDQALEPQHDCLPSLSDDSLFTFGLLLKFRTARFRDAIEILESAAQLVIIGGASEDRIQAAELLRYLAELTARGLDQDTQDTQGESA